MVKVSKTNLENVLIFQLEPFEDHRGTYTQLYRKDEYADLIKKEIGKEIEFLEDDFAVSSKHVLRGIHGDDRTWKLVTCLAGKFFITVVNCDEESKGFGKWQSFVLTRESGKQVLIPPKHGHAYVVLSDNAIFHYKQSCTYQGMEKQFTYKYNDPRFKIRWPIKNPIVSKRDDPELK
ncbi:dTDP-4-dehydrorhamnose 3,5-epimerase family protein [Patescibacteria group bacterium]